MTLRDKIMDKYWIEFLADCKGNFASSTYVARISNSQFWHWFYDSKIQRNSRSKLEDFLK
jgi:hypothetical protein